MRAAGGGILGPAEAAVATVAGRVEAVERLDARAYLAALTVERRLAGTVSGKRVRVVWEELSTRPPRFAPGERVLAVLEPAPGGSLWRDRLRERAAGDALYAVAGRGEAFLRQPKPSTIEVIGAYLALSRRQRAGREGVAALSAVAAVTAAPVADEAVALLGEIPDLGTQLSAAALAHWRQVLRPADPPAIAVALLSLAGQRRLLAVRGLLEPLARRGSALEAEALAALGEIDGGLPAATVEDLLARREPRLRAVGARFAPGLPSGETRLAELVRLDPAPVVRVAAVRSLVRSGRLEGLEAALPALGDPDAEVRRETAYAVAVLGGAAVPALAQVVDKGVPPAAQAAILALSRSGPSGTEALRRIAAAHRDPHVRAVAALALGRGPEAH